MDKVTICDHTFLEHTKSASIGGGNIGVGPTHFEWEYADAQTARFVTDGDIKHAKGKGQVAWLLEPYELHPENYWIAGIRRKDFDAVLFHSHWECGTHWYPYGGSWIAFSEWGMKEKTKDVSIIVSDKDTMSGHKLRHEVVLKLGNEHLDVFHDFPDKYDALAPYKYSIVIESEKSRYYFTEKLIDCLCVGTIPVYWGYPFDGINSKGIVTVDSVEEIEKFVKMPFCGTPIIAIERNIDMCRQYAICEDWIFEHYPELFA